MEHAQAGDGPGLERASAGRKTTGPQRRWTLSSTPSLWRLFGIKHPMTTPDAKQPLYGGGLEMVDSSGPAPRRPGPERGLFPRPSGGIHAGGRCRTSPTLICWCRLWLQVAGEMMDVLTRTSMSRASVRGESPTPASSGRHPTQRCPSRPCPATSESGPYRHPVADTPPLSDLLAVRGGRLIAASRRSPEMDIAGNEIDSILMAMGPRPATRISENAHL